MSHTYSKAFFIAMLIPFFCFTANYSSVIYPSEYFAKGMHSILSVSAFGNSLDIEDGSRWQIASQDASKIAGWKAQDPLMITQNNRWFPDFPYRIINHANGEIVEANLKSGPIKDGTYTHYIQQINFDSGEITLSDASRWQVSILDAGSYNLWSVNDPVIIGYNTGWDNEDCYGIIINVNQTEHIRVAQF